MSVARYVYLARLTVGLPNGDAANLYVSSGQTVPQTYDGALWRSVLIGDPPFTYTSEIELDETVGGPSRPGFGSLVIARDLLSLGDWADYYWDGRDVAIWRTPEGEFFTTSLPPIFHGVMDTPTFTEATITIPLRDLAAVLDGPAQIHQYLGTGGYEGGPELAGVTKPLVIGRTQSMEPIALDHAAPGLTSGTYSRVVQIHDGPLLDIPLVTFYERGRADFTVDPVVDVYAWTPVAGRVAVDFTRGVARLAATPQGVITVTAHTGILTHADVMEEVLTRTQRILPSEIDTASLAAFAAAQPATLIGVTITDDRTVGDVLDTVARSAGAFWTFTPQRQFQVRVIAWGAPVATIREDRLTEPLRYVPQEPPVWRYRFGYGPNERVLTDTDFGDTDVIPSVRKFLSRPFAYSIHESTTTQTDRRRARESTQTSRFGPDATGPNTAPFEGERQARLLRFPRHGFGATLRARFGTFRLGDTVILQHADYGLSAGKQFLVRKLTELPGYADDEDRVSLELWGPRDVAEGG